MHSLIHDEGEKSASHAPKIWCGHNSPPGLLFEAWSVYMYKQSRSRLSWKRESRTHRKTPKWALFAPKFSLETGLFITIWRNPTVSSITKLKRASRTHRKYNLDIIRPPGLLFEAWLVSMHSLIHDEVETYNLARTEKPPKWACFARKETGFAYKDSTQPYTFHSRRIRKSVSYTRTEQD